MTNVKQSHIIVTSSMVTRLRLLQASRPVETKLVFTNRYQRPCSTRHLTLRSTTQTAQAHGRPLQAAMRASNTCASWRPKYG